MKKWRPLIGSCAKKAAPTEKDFCHSKQQDAFFNCLKLNLIQILSNTEALKWAKQNCEDMQDYMLDNHKKIMKKFSEIGQKYIDSDCGTKKG